jgi:hypothetical protein
MKTMSKAKRLKQSFLIAGGELKVSPTGTAAILIAAKRHTGRGDKSVCYKRKTHFRENSSRY